MTKPKWVNTTRQAHLVSLFVRSRGFCVYGEPNCTIPEHHYEVFIESLINDWKADDRETNKQDWKHERKIMHALHEKPCRCVADSTGCQTTSGTIHSPYIILKASVWIV